MGERPWETVNMSSGVILNNIGNGELTVMLKRFSVINSCRIHYYSMKVFAFICSIKRLTTENKRPFSFFDFFKIRNITKGISSCLSRYNAKSIFDIWKSLTVGCHGGIIW